jgi:hypothetical protein
VRPGKVTENADKSSMAASESVSEATFVATPQNDREASAPTSAAHSVGLEHSSPLAESASKLASLPSPLPRSNSAGASGSGINSSTTESAECATPTSSFDEASARSPSSNPVPQPINGYSAESLAYELRKHSLREQSEFEEEHQDSSVSQRLGNGREFVGAIRETAMQVYSIYRIIDHDIKLDADAVLNKERDWSTAQTLADALVVARKNKASTTVAGNVLIYL